jgi:ankyrin repeat protein
VTSLHLACKHGFDDISEAIVDKLVSIRNLTSPMYDNLPMHFLCKNRNENVRLLRKMLNKIRDDSTEELQQILTRLDQNRHTMLQNGIEYNLLSIVDCLLEEFYNRDDTSDSQSTSSSLYEDRNGNLPIHYAAKTCGPEMLQVLIKNNCFSLRRNSNLDNAVHIAAANNGFKFIKEFLAYEKIHAEKLTNKQIKDYIPSVKCYNKSGYTPLFVALTAGNIKCVESILGDEELDLEAKDLKGNSIYHICAEFNSFESMRVLLNKKSAKFVEPLFIRNNKEDNVIQTACLYGNLEIIKLVIDKLTDGGFASTETYLLSRNKGYNCNNIELS